MNVDATGRHISLALFMFFTLTLNAGGTFKEINEQAMRLYHDGKYDESLTIWYDLIKTGNTDPNLYFNIGCAESIQGHVPESILAFEKAMRLKPGDHEIADAIKKERSKIENAVIPVNPFFLIEWYRKILGVFRPGTWVFTGVCALLIALVQWLISIKAISQFRVFRMKKYGLLYTLGSFLILIGYLSYHQLHRSDEAIIMSSCECRQAPSGESPLTRLLSPGEKVRITDHIAEWDKVSLLNLDEGWIKRECWKPIEIGL